MVRGTILWALPFLAATAALAGYGWSVTPEGAQVPVHFGLDGSVNRTGGKLEAFLAIPAVALGLSVLLAVAPAVDPRGGNLRRSGALYKTAWLGALAVLTLAQGAITAHAAGWVESGLPVATLTIGAVALLTTVIGNLLGKARPNWFVGIRTPWTLSSDKAWDATHRTGGWLLVATGLASLTLLVTGGVEIATAVLIGGALSSAVICVGLSWWVWRKDPDREQFSASDEE